MDSLTRTFSALADDTRLRMVEHLMDEGEVAAGDLAALTEISGPAVSRHLKVLRQAGLIEQRAQGTHRYYSVRPEGFSEISDWTDKHRKFWGGSLDRLGALLTRDPQEEDE